MKANFHLALPCRDLKKTRAFYIDALGGKMGRNSENWIDINLYGNQLTFTTAGDFKFDFKNYRLGDQILPSFHFGIIVDVELWGQLYARLISRPLDLTPKATYMKGKSGEHLSFFVKDPNGYMVEFKSFKNPDEVFMF
jgi:extradiol dioxygenase family protein